jgi:branched-chain amino acid transport system permease protein
VNRWLDRRCLATLTLLALLVLGPVLIGHNAYRMSIVSGAFFYAIMASSWVLLAGISGQFSFAHMAMMGIGAYASGLLGREMAMPPLAGIVSGTLLAGLVGLGIGFLCLRLRRAYLALFTIAFSEILRLILLTEFQYTGGANGLRLAPLYQGISSTAAYYINLALLLAALALMYRLAGSRFGLFLRAMREDQEAAAAMGVNVVRVKIMIFVITSMIVALAGATFYHQIGIITPNTMEILQMSLVIAMAVIGGIESLLGAALGAMVIRLALELLREINIFGLHIELGAWRYAAFGLLLLFTLRFAQNGLLHPIINRLFSPKAQSVPRPETGEPETMEEEPL